MKVSAKLARPVSMAEPPFGAAGGGAAAMVAKCVNLGDTPYAKRGKGYGTKLKPDGGGGVHIRLYSLVSTFGTENYSRNAYKRM